MDFKKAYELLKAGYSIKRKNWKGFWKLEDEMIMMYCKDGSVIKFLDTKSITFTMDQITANDWETVEDEKIEVLDVRTMTFGEAISSLKYGEKVARKGWNGKSQYIELAKNISYINSKNEIINVNHENIGNKAIAFVGTSGIQLGWLASQADMLANDWVIVN